MKIQFAKVLRPVLSTAVALSLCGDVVGQESRRDESLRPGDHARTLAIGDQQRTYILHVPKKYDRTKPTPVVLALHGALMDASMMVAFSGLNRTADEAGFLVVYPNGSGVGPFRTWNAGGFKGKLAARRADDVAFIRTLLNELGRLLKVDRQRVFACGMSNGAMMCYRLAAELSERIAAIAPVAGTMAIEDAKPKRAVPLIHFHGTADNLVPFDGPNQGTPKFLSFKSVKETIQVWCQIDGCPSQPEMTSLPDREKDGTTVKRLTYGPGREGAEVVLIEIAGGGHTWPGQTPVVGFIGKSTLDISANDLIWQFFSRHPMK